MRRPARGFTLVEVLCTCTVVGVLAGVALPSYRGQIVKSRRIDATTALMRLQAAEERYRSHHGLYSTDFQALQMAPSSSEGLYALAVMRTGPDSYRASATPLPGGGQADDHECPQFVLDVTSGFAQAGPSGRCWNR